MTESPQLTSLRKSFEKLERQKAKTLSNVASWTEAQMRFRPAPAGWSALEVLDHLRKVEKAFVTAVRKELPNGRPVGLKERFGAFSVVCVMSTPFRVKVGTASSLVLPDPAADLPLITERWSDTRVKIDQLLQSLQPQQCNVGLFRHPVSGWMTISQSLAFLSSHIKHHEYQLKRLQARR